MHSFLDSLENTAGDKYVPTETDLLRSRKPRYGISEVDYEREDILFVLFLYLLLDFL